MKILDRLGACRRLLRVNRSLFNAFDQIFKPLTADLLAKTRGDEFVIAYMYGVMTCFFDRHGIVGRGTQPAQILCRVYEFVFPGHGKEVVEMIVSRIKGKDETFMRDLRTGSKEACHYLTTRGKSGLPALSRHLARQ